MKPTMKYIFVLALACVLVLPMSGCKGHGSHMSTAQQNNAAVRRYHLRGTVLGKDIDKDELTVKHEDIPGLMPAMTMPYTVKNKTLLNEVQPGDQIVADVLVKQSDNGDYELDKVVITGHVKQVSPTDVMAAHPLLPWEKVPDLPLVNQDGKTIHLSDYRGKAVLITFIYTRCPLPTACPLISSHFSRVNDGLSKNQEAYKNSHLISISLDPVYDLPPVLRKYGLTWLHGNADGFSHWEFVDTTPANLRDLAGTFGLEYEGQGNQITHTMQTILIGPNGTVVQTWEGSGWDPKEVTSAVEKAASKATR
jgi:protein SCO1/2